MVLLTHRIGNTHYCNTVKYSSEKNREKYLLSPMKTKSSPIEIQTFRWKWRLSDSFHWRGFAATIIHDSLFREFEYDPLFFTLTARINCKQYCIFRTQHMSIEHKDSKLCFLFLTKKDHKKWIFSEINFNFEFLNIKSKQIGS